MKRNKKYILITVLSIAVAVGIVTGVVFAQSDNGDDIEPKARHEALLDRVCEIYEENTGVAIDPQALQDAFAEARGEMLDKAMDSRLQYLVDQGIITQEEADQYFEWWESRPDVQLPGCAPFGPKPNGPCGPRLGRGGGVLPYYRPPDAA